MDVQHSSPWWGVICAVHGCTDRNDGSLTGNCVDSTKTKAEDVSGAGKELRSTMTHIPEGANDREIIVVLRKALGVAGAKSLRKPLTVLAAAAAIGLAATIAVDPQSSGTVAAGVARGVIDGVILASNAWPSVPVNVQARLVLWSPDCSEQGQCEVSAAPINE
jgi:hypothetical protein